LLCLIEEIKWNHIKCLKKTKESRGEGGGERISAVLGMVLERLRQEDHLGLEVSLRPAWAT
jgi:hypothetical protein